MPAPQVPSGCCGSATDSLPGTRRQRRRIPPKGLPSRGFRQVAPDLLIRQCRSFTGCPLKSDTPKETSMKRKLTLTALILAAAVPMAAVAQDSGGYGSGQGTSPSRTTPSGTTPATPATPASPGERMGSGTAKDADATMFMELDRDKDGQVTKDEAKRSADLQARFDQLDTDRDGKLSMNEWNAGNKKTP
ncbi:hypothetical protein ebA5049 [Aromatoleum aromaticum EbN1]|uniref:EF-hand domain-containing protein n=2 Tax=Aromatoleum aromaticum TaxID=551760 RepID=Q5P126_AROAE|nr:hypothetical protein ebA5049 [Aromatoleum aromaticum EbN1]